MPLIQIPSHAEYHLQASNLFGHEYLIARIVFHQVGVFPDLEEIIKKHAYDTECGKYVSTSVQHIVKKSSLTQSIKGILTAGFIKTLRYSSSKVLKKLRSR